MKLLIADDEKLTREGIRDSLDLEALGISGVFLADDGVHGLETALEELPDIVLTDIRMPRMNGVEMAEKLLEQLPDTSLVFMSAYSDKEYLKAAIKLKAVSYVEKPLDIRELADRYNGGRPIKVVANLPYYITTPIIMGLFESGVPIDNITVMVQKEVADRMKEGPGSKDYGALSLAVQYYAKPEIVANVPPNCFIPRPNVGSAVIRLTRHTDPPVTVRDEKLMFKLIRASFNQRRKTLQNGLNNATELPFSKEKVAAAIARMGLPASVRGEALTLSQFAELSDILGEP